MSDRIWNALSLMVVTISLLAIFGVIEIPLWASFALAGVAMIGAAHAVRSIRRD